MEILTFNKGYSVIQKISQLQPTIAFSEFDFYNNYTHSFDNSEIGLLHRALPFEDLTRSLGLEESPKGRNSYFGAQRKLALMFLKSYTGLLAADSIYATNSNQKFCSKRGIITGFVRKGRAGKDEEQLRLMRSVLSKERSTRPEGSFGTEKQQNTSERYYRNRLFNCTGQSVILS